jgi:hypothetical protein
MLNVMAGRAKQLQVVWVVCNVPIVLILIRQLNDVIDFLACFDPVLPGAFLT